MKILEALKIVYKNLSGFGADWILTGSTALAIRGVDVAAVDIDILTNQNDVEKIDQALAEYRLQKPDFSETEKYRSYYGIYKIDGVKIDLMAEFQYKFKNGSWSAPNQDNAVELVNYEGMCLPMLSLEQELIEYENMDRVDKAEKIKSVPTLIN